MYQRPQLDLNSYTPHTAGVHAAFHADVVSEVSTAVSRDAVVVVGMATNVFCRRARKALDEAGIAHTYLEYGGYASKWRPRLAIKMWSGWPTFPQVFVKGVLIGGCTELQAALASGDLKRWLEQGPPRA